MIRRGMPAPDPTEGGNRHPERERERATGNDGRKDVVHGVRQEGAVGWAGRDTHRITLDKR